MNSQSIATYIANLEKENADLKKRLQQCEEEKALLEYETMLQYAEVSDDESIASTDSDDDDIDFFVSYNTELTDAFDKLAYEEENEFKQAVYEKAANAIYRLDFKVKYGEQLTHLPGIGKGVIRKVNEFLETGEIKRKQTFDTNEDVADQLETLACLEAEPHGSQDVHKINAYQKAAEAIRKLKFEVTNGTELWKGPLKVPGIGKGIANKIDEYIVTGKIGRIEKLDI
jgi:DNA polymerase/3'-5' exonuclease PolX